MIKIEVVIKYSPPYDPTAFIDNISWFCPENIRVALKKSCTNTEFEIDYSKRFKRKLSRKLKKEVKKRDSTNPNRQ